MRTNLFIFLITMACFAGIESIAQINMPQPSPAGSVYTKVGLTDVTVDYFRPSAKGRKIFGEGSDYLQPYGQIWRTGANTGTVLKFSTDVTIGGSAVKAGEYLVFTVPGASEWKFMLYSDLSIGGNTGAYNAENEVLNISVPVMNMPFSIETLTIEIGNIAPDNTGAEIFIIWENTGIAVPIKVDFHEAVMKEIASKTQVSPNNYIAAANYYLATNQDLEKAYEWAKKGTADGQFWNVHLQAQILAKLGRKDDAIKTAEESLKMAQANGNDFGYVKRNEDLIASLK